MKLTYRDLAKLLNRLTDQELDMVVTVGTEKGFIKAKIFKHISSRESSDLGKNTLVIDTICN